MSRGLGRVELRILELLARGERLRPARIAFEIASHTEPTAALRRSVGQALASLRKKGHLVRVMGDWMLAETWQRGVNQREREEVSRRRRQTQEKSEELPADDQARQDGRDNALCNPIDYRVEFRRLPKILALLGSPHEGEVLNAARQAEQIRCRLKLTWEDMITLPERLVSNTETTVATTEETRYGPNF